MLGFPRIVDEVAVRTVAGVVAASSLLALATGWRWIVVLLAYGFVARVAAGPRLSPLALLVTRVVRPRMPLAERPVPGPPKRFAQAMGATLTVTAAVLLLALGAPAGWWLVGAVAAAATLESAFGLCLGCRIFALLMRTGIVPDSICAECADLRLRRVEA
ncbi:MAG TPA: DUF4395 domain-containing protein [Solirubrobacteraceae bacterium]|nr:DUF4395 domain-containing protein [Solirubrobacteraceae bacterium]